MYELLKQIAKVYWDLLDLRTPLGAGDQGERNTLADSLATIVTGLASITAAISSSALPGPLQGVMPETTDLIFAAFIVLMCWLIATYVLIAARDANRFKHLAPLNLNLVLIWLFISALIVVITSYIIGEPGNRATQSIVAGTVSILAIGVHVGLAGRVAVGVRSAYGIALIVSVVFFMDRMYGYESRIGML